MGNEPSTLSKTGFKRVPTSHSMEEEGSGRSEEEVARRQLAATVTPMNTYMTPLHQIGSSVYQSAPPPAPQPSGPSQTLRFRRTQSGRLSVKTATGDADDSVRRLGDVLVDSRDISERCLSFSGSSRALATRLDQESILLANEISHLLTCCGINDRPGRKAIWDEYYQQWHVQRGGDDTLQLFAAAALAKGGKVMNVATAVDGCEFMQKMISLYFIASDAPPIHSRRFCVKLMGDFLLDPKNRDADPAYVADGLRKIKARHLLPAICTAGEMIRRRLLTSGEEAHVLIAQALKQSIDRIPEQFLLAVPPFLRGPDRGLPLDETVARITTCYREDDRDKALNLARHAFELIMAPGPLGFEAGVDRLVERLYTRLIDPSETALAPDEASAWLRRLFIRYFKENTRAQAAYRYFLQDGRDPVEYLSGRLNDTLKALSETSKGRLALAFYQLEFDSFGLDLTFDANLGVSQGGNAVVPYNSVAHAGAVLHYVSVIGRIEYFGEELMLPLLEFVAREAQGEALAHRRGLHDEVSIIADALKRFGPRYEAKGDAIRAWLDANPFG
jgi:hypothetical protein